ncbi:TVP38/TMEM64 family protein [Maritalea mediterranea]|uniref:TVP38/TMEM64 family membrane protein n=1 Tax=Maritalea mediterranea TaxID=2909667 RepID=A0ABS9E5G8_9HYPH|nr:TVP38/TMEM64 family protein [Maritalea mediterranea]MCF4097509.1 TVP38/TMEM64 family protein [Maritalea mediterranea]
MALLNQTNRSLLKRWLPPALLVMIVVVLYVTGSYKWISVEALVQNYTRLTAFVGDYLLAAVLIYMAFYALAVALSFPAAWVLTVSGGLLLGWWVAGLATIFAATVGASVLFFIAKTSLGEHMRENARGYIQKMRAGFQQDAVNYMLFLRLTPVFPFTLVNIVPGILGVPFRIFFWTTFVGIAPGSFAYSYAGEGLDSIVRAQADAYEACVAAGNTPCGISLKLGNIVTTDLLIALGALGVAALIPTIIKRLRKPAA